MFRKQGYVKNKRTHTCWSPYVCIFFAPHESRTYGSRLDIKCRYQLSRLPTLWVVRMLKDGQYLFVWTCSRKLSSWFLRKPHTGPPCKNKPTLHLRDISQENSLMASWWLAGSNSNVLSSCDTFKCDWTSTTRLWWQAFRSSTKMLYILSPAQVIDCQALRTGSGLSPVQ